MCDVGCMIESPGNWVRMVEWCDNTSKQNGYAIYESDNQHGRNFWIQYFPGKELMTLDYEAWKKNHPARTAAILHDRENQAVNGVPA